jgi:hypothetical protein
VENITIDVAGNTAYSQFTVEGVSNTNQQPFHGVRGTMVFEFTDPAQPTTLVQRDWLLMDVVEIDNLIFQQQPLDPAAAQALAAAAQGLANATLDALGKGAPVTDVRCSQTVIEGPGGYYFPRGPYLGQAGFAKVAGILPSVITTWSLQSMTTDLAARTTVALFTIGGKGRSTGTPFSQPCLVTFRWANDSLPTLRSMSYATNSMSFD